MRSKNKTINYVKYKWEAMTQIRQDLPSRQWDTTLVYRTKNKPKKIFKGRLEVCPFYALDSRKPSAILGKGNKHFRRCVMHKFIKVNYVGTKNNREVYAYTITTPKGEMKGNIVSKTKIDIAPQDALSIIIRHAQYDDFVMDGLEQVFTDSELNQLIEENAVVFASRN